MLIDPTFIFHSIYGFHFVTYQKASSFADLIEMVAQSTIWYVSWVHFRVDLNFRPFPAHAKRIGICAEYFHYLLKWHATFTLSMCTVQEEINVEQNWNQYLCDEGMRIKSSKLAHLQHMQSVSELHEHPVFFTYSIIHIGFEQNFASNV